MIKPKRLKTGDTVAIVSLSSGMLGDAHFRRKYELGKKCLEERFGLNVAPMPNALKGSRYLYDHPEKRAQDLMAACADKSIAAIITAIGGDDTIRLLPYIDYDVIRDNPKIFMGYSDTTANCLMFRKAGVVSYYGPAFLSDFAQDGGIDEYTETALKRLLFDAESCFEIEKCPYWYPADITKPPERIRDGKGYEVIQDGETVRGKLLGGCIDAFPIYNGTEICPQKDEWKDKIMFLETSIGCPPPEFIADYLRNLGAQGCFDNCKGIIVGKPAKEKYYEQYKAVYKKIVKEFGREDMPILYNANFGHAAPIGIIPYDIDCELNVR